MTADGLKAGGWRLTARRQETEKGDELPTALVASRSCPSCLPRRIRAGLAITQAGGVIVEVLGGGGWAAQEIQTR